MHSTDRSISPLLSGNTEELCIKQLERMRWPHGIQCLKCRGRRVFQYRTRGKTGKTRHLYQCVDCKFNFSVTTGTLFHNSHLPLRKWFQAMAIFHSSSRPVTAKLLQRELGLGSYKTAWLMSRKLRLAMH